MFDRFKAIWITWEDDCQRARTADLDAGDRMDSDVTAAVSHSTMHYKDGLAITGRAPLIRRHPMIPGIDLAGLVAPSDNPQFGAGDRVFVNGCGLGETHSKMRVWPLPRVRSW
ncbi:MAG TPA: hypothetical protein VGF97_14250 [Rhizomicrobium sp.]|jgi:acrylyl-CoA reductase (NADPH)